jgi:hypothetical protein
MSNISKLLFFVFFCISSLKSHAMDTLNIDLSSSSKLTASKISETLKDHKGKITCLDISDNFIGDDALSVVSHYADDIECIYLNDNCFTDKGAVYLEAFKKVLEVDISRNYITDQGIVHLPMENLEVLQVNFLKLGYNGLNIICSRASKLNHLNICGAGLDDSSLPLLLRMGNLKILDISYNKLSRESIDTLLIKLSNVEIVYDYMNPDLEVKAIDLGLGKLSLKETQCPHCSHLRAECLTARDGAGGATGKWQDAVTPKRGWVCQGAEDLGGLNLTCEMCESRQVRYAHHMEHGQLRLDVGCECAGHMEGRFTDQKSIDQAIQNAKRRTSDLENRAKRRTKFLNLLGWKQVGGINYCLKKKGHTIYINRSKFDVHKYRARVDGNDVGDYVTIDEAKYNAFDYIWPPRVSD